MHDLPGATAASAQRQGRAAGPRPLPVVGARPTAPGRAGDPGRHRPAGLPRPRRLSRRQRPARLRVSFIDSIYYTTVTLSTTGYGDIAPVTDRARLINAFVITPLRIAFLVLLIGTTLEVLASQGREMFRVARWRKNMGAHVVVVGYGTKGRSAVETLVNNGHDREAIVVVDPSALALEEAHSDGLAVVTGDATRREVLRSAGVQTATQVIITTDRDDTNVLSTLTVRQLNPDAWIVAAVREQENVPLMRQSGANSVITSSDAVGRLLGLSSMSPMLGSVMEDLLTYGEGLEVAERDLLVSEVGKPPQSLPDQVIAVVRDEKVYRYFDPVVTLLARGDRLIVVRPGEGAAVGAAPRDPRRGAGRRGLSPQRVSAGPGAIRTGPRASRTSTVSPFCCTTTTSARRDRRPPRARAASGRASAVPTDHPGGVAGTDGRAVTVSQQRADGRGEAVAAALRRSPPPTTARPARRAPPWRPAPSAGPSSARVFTSRRARISSATSSTRSFSGMPVSVARHFRPPTTMWWPSGVRSTSRDSATWSA